MTKPKGPTETHRRILTVLSDGRPHSKQELMDVLLSDAEPGTLKVHICAIRKLLLPRGENILIEYVRNKLHYRHVRLLRSYTDGKT